MCNTLRRYILHITYYTYYDTKHDVTIDNDNVCIIIILKYQHLSKFRISY